MTLAQRASKGILWAQAGKLVETALGMLLSVLVIRRLGPAAYGEYGLLIGLMFAAMLLTWLGFAEILGKHMPVFLAESHLDRASALFRWTFFWRFLISLAMVMFFMVFIEPLARLFHMPTLPAYRWSLSALFVSQNLFSLSLSCFDALLATKLGAMVNLCYWVLSLALTVAGFRIYGPTPQTVLIASALATVAALGIALLSLRHWLVKGRDMRHGVEGIWRFSGTVWLTTLANFGLQSQSDVLMLGALVPDKMQIGLYRAAVMPVQRLMGFIMGGWQGIAMPVLSEAAATGGSAAIQKAWSAYVKLILLLAAPLLLLLAVTADTFLPLLYSDAYASSVALLQLYALVSILGFAVGFGLNTKLMQTLHLETLALRLRLIASVLNIVLNLILIPRFGAAGAVLATSSAGTLMWLVETRMVITRFSLSYPWSFLFKVLAASALGAAGALVLPGGTWGWFIAQVALYGSLFVAALFLLKPLNEEEQVVISHLFPPAGRFAALFQKRSPAALP